MRYFLQSELLIKAVFHIPISSKCTLETVKLWSLYGVAPGCSQLLQSAVVRVMVTSNSGKHLCCHKAQKITEGRFTVLDFALIKRHKFCSVPFISWDSFLTKSWQVKSVPFSATQHTALSVQCGCCFCLGRWAEPVASLLSSPLLCTELSLLPPLLSVYFNQHHSRLSVWFYMWAHNIQMDCSWGFNVGLQHQNRIKIKHW